MPKVTSCVFAVLVGSLVLGGCTSYIPLTGKMMRERNLAPDELAVVQFYIDKEIQFKRKVRDKLGVADDGRLEGNVRITEVVLLEKHTPGVQLGCSILDRDPLKRPASDTGTTTCDGKGPPDDQRGVRLWVTFERGTRLPFLAYGNGSFTLDAPGGVVRLNEHDYQVTYDGKTPPYLVLEEGAEIRRVVRRRLEGERVQDFDTTGAQ